MPSRLKFSRLKFSRLKLSRICSSLLFLFLVADCAAQADFTPLFSGRDLTGWRNVNTAPSTWTVRDGMIVTTGKPIGELCTTQQYENFILGLEWRHMVEGGNAGLFIHSAPLTAVGQPFTRAIEAQVMDGNHGDVFAIHGATMVPDRPHPQGWMRSLPIEERANPTGEWNHYHVESRDGTVTLAVNGKIVSGGSEISPRKGFICLESEGSEAHFRNIRISELPSTDPEPDEVADSYEGFSTLYTGVDLSGWEVSEDGPWEVDDWVLRHAGSPPGGEHLWTDKSYGDFELIADIRLECDSADSPSQSAIFVRGRPAARIITACSTASTAAGPALAAIDESTADGRGWQRLRIRITGNHAVIELGEREIARGELP
ncbi:MAG: DUF1080 domain-containing protein, partial [Rhodothermales bacterium]